jgi:hypothetical protein
MNRLMLTCVLLAFATAAGNAQQAAQQPAQSGQYSGQSNPPADDTITAQPDQPVQTEPPAKPRAGTPLVTPAPATEMAQPAPSQPAPINPSANYPRSSQGDGTDDGIVHVAQPENQPGLSTRPNEDPDSDIVHPHPLAPGEVAEGTMIRVRLDTSLSTSRSEMGEVFKSHVASDVLQDGQVLIPAGAEIDGRVVEVSEGRTGGHGRIRLRPDTVILADGQRYHMDAQVTGTPGTKTRVSSEGTINAGSRWKKDGLEYGGAVGAGAVTGAVIAGPVGALTGSLIGAGAITVHLLTDHPQARLEPGTVLLITLNSRLNLVATTTATN